MDDVPQTILMNKATYITQQLEKLVLSEKYMKDTKLPSQGDLAKEYNVGTRTIREALKNLEAKGLVTIQQGKGIFVKEKNLDFYFQSLAATFSCEFPHNKKMLLDLTKVRELLEKDAIHSFFKKPDDTLIEELNQFVKEMEEYRVQKNLSDYRKIDILFHQKLISASNNEVINYFYKHLTNLMLFSISNTETLYNYKGFEEHKELIKALKERNEKEALSVIKEHLLHTFNTLRKLKLDE